MEVEPNFSGQLVQHLVRYRPTIIARICSCDELVNAIVRFLEAYSRPMLHAEKKCRVTLRSVRYPNLQAKSRANKLHAIFFSSANIQRARFSRTYRDEPWLEMRQCETVRVDDSSPRPQQPL